MNYIKKTINENKTHAETQSSPIDKNKFDIDYIKNLIKQDPILKNSIITSLSSELIKGNITKETFDTLKRDILNISSEPFTYKTYSYAPIVNKQEMENLNIFKYMPNRNRIFITN